MDATQQHSTDTSGTDSNEGQITTTNTLQSTPQIFEAPIPTNTNDLLAGLYMILARRSAELDRAIALAGGQQSEQSASCPICYEPMAIKETTQCGHTFCDECLGIWRMQSNSCPMCRRTFPPPSSVMPGLILGGPFGLNVSRHFDAVSRPTIADGSGSFQVRRSTRRSWETFDEYLTRRNLERRAA